MNITPINPAQLPSVWLEVENLLQLPYNREELNNTMSLSQLHTALLENKAQLWVAWCELAGIYAAGITRIQEVMEDKRVCEVISCAACSSSRLDWSEVIQEYIQPWARDVENCQEIWVTGRIGWTKALKPAGFTVASVTLTKKLNEV